MNYCEPPHWVDWYQLPNSAFTQNLVDTIRHKVEAFECDRYRGFSGSREGDAREKLDSIIFAIVHSVLKEETVNKVQEVSIDYLAYPGTVQLGQPPEACSEDPRYVVDLLCEQQIGLIKAVANDDSDCGVPVVTTVSATEELWRLFHIHLSDPDGHVHTHSGGDPVGSVKGPPVPQPNEGRVQIQPNPLDHSRPLDVHTWSDHPEVNDFIDDVFGQISSMPGNQDIRRKHVKVVLLDLYLAWCDDPDLKIAFDRGADAYKAKSRYNALHISKLTPKVVDKLEEAGFVEQATGFLDRTSGIGRTSRMWPTSKLLSLFKDAAFEPFDIGDHAGRETIILRRKDENGNRHDLEYHDTPDTHAMREQLRAYNALLRDTFIDIPTLEQNRIVLHEGDRRRQSFFYVSQRNKLTRRIFSRGSFDKGGRFYGGWWQRCPKEFRHAIFLDDKPVSEIDFSGLHMVMLYALRSIDYWTDIGIDPYEIDCELPAGHWLSLRDICKQLTLVALNAKTEEAAFQAFRDDAEDGSPEKKMNNHQLRAILDALKAKHTAIADMFASDAGIDLMNLDAQITAHVIESFTQEDIPVLSIHDSYLVPYDLERELIEQMKIAFAVVMGQQNIKLSNEIHNPWDFEPMEEGDGVDIKAWEAAIRYRFDPPRTRRYKIELKRFEDSRAKDREASAAERRS